MSDSIKNDRALGCAAGGVVFADDSTGAAEALAAFRQALAGADEYLMKPFDGDILHSKFAEAGLV